MQIYKLMIRDMQLYDDGLTTCIMYIFMSWWLVEWTYILSYNSGHGQVNELLASIYVCNGFE